MKDKFKNKYRIESNRMPGWDYAGNGVYYITFVTQNRICNLGYIVVNQDGKATIQLSDFGKIVKTEFLKSFEICKELYLDEYIIMPNHLHAIIELQKPTDMPNDKIVVTHVDYIAQTDDGDMVQTDDDNIMPHGDDIVSHDGDIVLHGGDIGGGVETHGRASLPATTNNSAATTNNPTAHSNEKNKNNNFYRKPQSISSFIAGYKSVINSKIDDFIDDHNLAMPKYNRNNHFFQPNYFDHIIRNNDEYWRIKFYIRNNPKNWTKDKFNRI